MNFEQFLTLAVPGSRWARTKLTADRHTAELTITSVTHGVDEDETGLPQVTVRFREVWWDGSGSEMITQPYASRFGSAEWQPAQDLSFTGDRMREHSWLPGRPAFREWTYLGPPAGPTELPPAADRSTVGPRRVADLAPGDVVYGPWQTWQLEWRTQPGYTVDHVDLSTALAVVYTREGWPMWLGHDTPVAVAVEPATGPAEPAGEAPEELPTVFLTVNTVSWLWRTDTGLADVPMCISRNRLAGYGGRLKEAVVPELLIDSGGFTELKHHGRHRLTPEQFVTEIRTFLAHLAPGQRVRVAQQDWMCEEVVIYGGRTKDGTFVGTRPGIDPDGVMSFDELVHEHQRRSVANLVELRRIAPDLDIIPVVQGFTLMQYARHAGMLEQAGIRLADEPLVGLGSVCRRQGSRDIEQIVRYLARLGIALHGFGVGVKGLEMYGDRIASSDSNAFSYNGRVKVGLCPHGVVKREANCPVKAREWWDGAQARLRRGIRTRLHRARPSTRTPVHVPAPRRPVAGELLAGDRVADVWADVLAARTPTRVPAPRRTIRVDAPDTGTLFDL